MGNQCIVCGQKNYPLSYGGPDICPSCDCGNTIKIGNNLYKKINQPDTEERDGGNESQRRT